MRNAVIAVEPKKAAELELGSNTGDFFGAGLVARSCEADGSWAQCQA